MRDTEAERENSAPAVSLLVLEGIIAVVTSFFVLFRRIEVPHCHLQCDFALLYWTGNSYVVFVVILVVGSVVAVWFSRRHRWWVPAAGIATMVVAAIAANRLSDIALLYG